MSSDLPVRRRMFVDLGGGGIGGETPINHSVTLYGHLKEKHPEFIEELEKKVGVIGAGSPTIVELISARTSSTSSSTSTGPEIRQGRLERRSSRHTASTYSTTTTRTRQGGRLKPRSPGSQGQRGGGRTGPR